jgi:hypothetical protein
MVVASFVGNRWAVLQNAFSVIRIAAHPAGIGSSSILQNPFKIL